jgi:hypothetical protein
MRTYGHKSFPKPAAPRRAQVLSFVLPPALGHIVPGRHRPSPDGCHLEIEPTGLVHVTGPSLVQIFEHTARFLRHLVKGKTAIALKAVLVSPSEHPPGSSVREGWSIVVGDEVSFGLTEFGAEIPAAAAPAATASAGAMQAVA